MNEETKSKSMFGYWLFGLLTGAGIAAPITAYFVKKVYDKKNPVEEPRQHNLALLRPPMGISEEHIPTAEEINNYDLAIPDEEATESSRIASEDQERMRDIIERYNGTLAEIPFVISQEKFFNEQSNEKSFVNWYDKDNVFEEDLMVTRDPSASFGVSNGADLFASADPDDPDTVYVRNNKQATDYEITRVHGSYKEMVEGAPNIGEADSN